MKVDVKAVERRNFFLAVTNINQAIQSGQPPDDFLEEIEAIVMHTDQDVLRRRAQQVLDDHRKIDKAAG